MRDNVVLIGMMGCGKSTVGKLLAQTLGFAFVDTDQYIEAALGRSIPDIFAKEGEAFFGTGSWTQRRRWPRGRVRSLPAAAVCPPGRSPSLP